MPGNIIRSYQELCVIGIIVIVIEIPSAHVIDISVGVVVQSIVGDFLRICPDVGGEILMGKPGSGVDDRHSHLAIQYTFAIPSFRGVYICIGGACILHKWITYL